MCVSLMFFTLFFFSSNVRINFGRSLDIVLFVLNKVTSDFCFWAKSSYFMRESWSLFLPQRFLWEGWKHQSQKDGSWLCHTQDQTLPGCHEKLLSIVAVKSRLVCCFFSRSSFLVDPPIMVQRFLPGWVNFLCAGMQPLPHSCVLLVNDQTDKPCSLIWHLLHVHGPCVLIRRR